MIAHVYDYAPPDETATVVIFKAFNGSDDIRFAADRRPAQELIAAIERGDEPLVELASWQILSIAADEYDGPADHYLD